MTDTAGFRPTIRTQADLERTWRHLMEPLGFSGMSIWLMLLDADRRPLPQLTQIEDSTDPPSGPLLDGLAEVLGTVAAEHPGSSWAFLHSRPGRAGVTDLDRAWGRAMHEACRLADVACEVMHLATGADLVPLPLDELGVTPLRATG